MFFISAFLLGCVATALGSTGPSYSHPPERDPLFHDVEFNSNLEGLSLGEFLARQDRGSDSQLTRTVPSTPVISSCAAFIDYFGEVAANFSNCVVSFARPLRVCENCVEQFYRAKNAFDLVMNGKHRDDHNADCGDVILNSDRVQIIVRTYSFMNKVWADCDCKSCFDLAEGKNGTIRYRLSNDTVRFHELAVTTLKCFENNSVITPSSNGTRKNVSLVCTRCADVYHEMNDLYNHLVDKSHHHVCMDIVDTMNSTRLEWSKVYKCSVKLVDPTPVFIISGLFCLLPIAFYVGNCIYVTRSQNAVLQKNASNTQDAPEDTDNVDSS